MTNIYILSFSVIGILFHSARSYGSNQDECPRIRRGWHALSTEERDLYISGLLQLRANGEGDIHKDEFIAIASVHEDEFAPVTHKASSYLFWHGYFVWELETRIRNLGGKYSCFGMPFWDYTIENGREENPFIFSTGLGGNGDIDNFWTVNDYSWQHSIQQYWVPYNCFSQDDNYPICSLKRSLREHVVMPTAEEVGEGIIKNTQFIQFAKWYATASNPFHLFTDSPILMSPSPVTTSFDPIWYLFHSMVQYHQAIWVDCNDYDLIDSSDLDQHPEAYKAYCVHGECVRQNLMEAEWLQFELDDVMHFGGLLQDSEWSYIHQHDLTVRKLYDIAQWGIVYDLADGEGFYTKSGLKEYCEGKLNEKWFILNEDKSQTADNASWTMYLSDNYSMYHALCVVALLLMTFGVLLYAVPVWRNPKQVINEKQYHSYGAV